MCGVRVTWCIGRNNNGSIGADNQVRGEAVNTRVVKLLPVESRQDGSTKKTDIHGEAPVQNEVDHEQKYRSHEEDTSGKADSQDAHSTIGYVVHLITWEKNASCVGLSETFRMNR